MRVKMTRGQGPTSSDNLPAVIKVGLISLFSKMSVQQLGLHLKDC